MRFFPIFAMFALLSAQAFAYDVSIMVTVSQGTLAVGTNVTIVKDGVGLYSERAGADGVARFQLDEGSYFVLLDRGGYPRYVSILEVSGTTNLTRTMSQGMSYASVYGQIKGPSDFSGVSIGAFLDGRIANRAAPNKDGYYLISPLQAGNYEFAFTASGFDEKKAPLALSTSVFSELNALLEKTVVAPPEPPTLSAPATADRKTVIEVLLARGSAPMAGEKISVQTPAGAIEVLTGADGKARVNAAQAGKYTFAYGSLAATTIVAGEIAPKPEPPPAIEPEPQAPDAQAAKQDGNGFLAAFAVFGVVALIVVIAAAIFIAARMEKKQHKKGHVHDEGESHSHASHLHHKK